MARRQGGWPVPVDVKRDVSSAGSGLAAAARRKRPPALTMRRVRSFSSLARWNGILFLSEFQLNNFFSGLKTGATRLNRLQGVRRYTSLGICVEIRRNMPPRR
jgi:hypothetical protein